MTTPKFRVWDGEQMHEPPHDFLLATDGKVAYWDRDEYPSDNFVLPSDEYEPLFYTGRTDAEGTEVYEGDLISAKFPILFGTQRIGLWRVEYDAARASFQIWHDVEQQPLLRAQDVKIHGNKHQNPDLLEQEPAA